MFRELLILLTFSLSLQHASTLNILAIVSVPLRSHYMAFQSLFRELAVRGHAVTVMNNYPDKNPVRNLTFIDLEQETDAGADITPMNFYEDLDSSYLLQLFNYYRHFELTPESNEEDCDNFFTHEKVKAHFAKGIKYDVIFVEQFIGDCGLVYAGLMYDAPIIGITSHVLMPLAYSRLGIKFDFNADSFYFSKAGPYPSLYDKVESVFLHYFFTTIGRWYLQRPIYQVFNKRLPNVPLDVEDLAKDRIKMMFVYQHFSLTGTRPLPPQVLEIGGLHVGKPKPVPEEIEKFLSRANDGVIYVSFGSNLQSSTMSKNKMQEFLNAFKRLPQKVIWKYENASVPAGHDNIYFHSWMPQLDILCHPKVVAFVSHGGMLGLSEAVHCGKPVLTIPFFGDQLSNAAAARAVGIGVTLYFDKLNSDNLERSIKYLTSAEMQQNAKIVSKQWHDRPLSIMDSAIYWTEYVARHRTSPPPLPSQRTTWFQSLLLDVAAVIIVLIMAAILVMYFFLKIITFISGRLFQSLRCKTKTKND